LACGAFTDSPSLRLSFYFIEVRLQSAPRLPQAS